MPLEYDRAWVALIVMQKLEVGHDADTSGVRVIRISAVPHVEPVRKTAESWSLTARQKVEEAQETSLA